MNLLERMDIETGSHLILPFYLLEDRSRITSYVLRSPKDVQYACLNSGTFEPCRAHLITKDEFDCKRLEAQLNECENAIYWYGEWVDSLWHVLEVKSFDTRFYPSNSVGHLSGHSVRELLPKTYEQFSVKRKELVKKQQDFEKYINSLRPEPIGESIF
jgi:hypothetical protein